MTPTFCNWELWNARNLQQPKDSCLENFMDRAAWQAIVHRITKTRTQRSTHTQTHTRNPLALEQKTVKISSSSLDKNSKNKIKIVKIVFKFFRQNSVMTIATTNKGFEFIFSRSAFGGFLTLPKMLPTVFHCPWVHAFKLRSEIKRKRGKKLRVA